MDEIKAKQQVVEKIKEASKILVTVSDNPSVDALSAALGLTLLLDKQEKYATAIFSGETPPAIAFLEPEKTFDDTTDSLRDFIIALNKEKADHLRYKIEGDAVKIFITPYKTTISQDDLEFSQGDYNVELVIALGVDNQDSLDKALENHGQILHDAAIITVTADGQTSDLGGVDWHDASASSLSEMIAGLAEALKEDKKKSLLDTPIATALLTGIVAETDRFSNEHTTSRVMTVAASLMSAGADQQLIANELQQARSIEVSEVSDETPEDDSDDIDTTGSDDGDSEAQDEADGLISIKKDPTSFSVAHDGETLAELDERIRGEEAAQEKIEEEIEAAEEEAEEQAEKREQEAIVAATPKIEPVFAPEPLSEPTPEPTPGPVYQPSEPAHAYAVEPEPVPSEPQREDDDEPTFGGTLNATTDQAEEDKRRAIEDDQNRTILSHSYIGNDPAASANTNVSGVADPSGFPGTPDMAPGSLAVNDVAADNLHSAYALDDAATLSGLGGERVIEPLAPAQDTAYAQQPADLGLPLPPPVPDFSQGLAAAIPTQPEPAQQPAILGDILAPEPPVSTGLDYETTNTVAAPGSAYAFEESPSLPPLDQLPEAPVEQVAPAPVDVPPQAPPAAPNPGQFQIPGQQ